jgi:hypothetical protein
MATSHLITAVSKLKRAVSASRFLLLALLAFTTSSQAQPGTPSLSTPKVYGAKAFLTLTNCNDTNLFYFIQISTNLLDWVPCQSNGFFPTSSVLISVPSTNPVCFYRVLATPRPLYPIFLLGIICRSNLNFSTRTPRIDSFDSGDTNFSSVATASPSNNVVMIYDSSKAKSGGNVGVASAKFGDVNIGNGSIYGHLHTGPWDVVWDLQMGSYGVVGALDWNPTGNPQIEDLGTPTSWWTPDFNPFLPDVQTPILAGALSIPPPANGYVTLTGGNYVRSTSWSSTTPFMITGPTTLWVKGSLTGFNAVFAGTNASLILYVGWPTGGGDQLTLKAGGTLNSPGYARNLQIFGLPSLTSIDLHGNAAWTAAVYAPEAIATTGGGGNNLQEASGAIVVKGLTESGPWNFHYDESLKANGPVH